MAGGEGAVESMGINQAFWAGKRVFITGHTGFKGGWLATWLLKIGAQVTGYALKPQTDPSLYNLCGLENRFTSLIADVRNLDGLTTALRRHEPDIVFHLAAQSLVRRSYGDPVETFGTNVMGTVHVLEAARHTPSVRAVLIVTSDKCYENRESARGYRESDSLGGRDPYSASKGCAELVTAAYRRSFLERQAQVVGVATARAGNVIGGGDWAEDRLVPDTIRALDKSDVLLVRNPKAVRPWQHVLEPVAGYLTLAERLFREPKDWSGPWNFGPAETDTVSVETLVRRFMQRWGSGTWRVEGKQSQLHEQQILKLDWSQARARLGWHPRLNLEEAVALTVEWYRNALAKRTALDLYELTVEQIAGYEVRLNSVKA